MNEHFLNSAANAVKQTLPELDHSLSSALTRLGIFPYRKGHKLIKDCVLYYLVQYEKGISGDLYRTVSLWHNCLPGTLESNIRSALKAAHNSGKLSQLNDLLGAVVLDETCGISNLQFISLIAQYCYYYSTPLGSVKRHKNLQ